MGVNHSTQGTETVNAICNLALLTGHIGRAGAAPFSITGQCNAMGTREAGFASSLPGYRKFENADGSRGARRALERRRVAAARQARPGVSRHHRSAPSPRRFARCGSSPPIRWFRIPNQDVLRQALSNLDFLVVQDGYHPTPTTELADLVLPAAIWGEKEGTYTNSERRVSKVNKAVEPPGEARSDFDIFLARRRKARLPRRAVSRLDHASRTPSTNGGACREAGCATTPASATSCWPSTARCSGRCPRAQIRASRRASTPMASSRRRTAAPDSCARTGSRFPEQPGGDYPFVLNTGRTVEHWHTRTKTREVPILERLSPRAWLEMNPRDAKRAGAAQPRSVDVVSRRGRVRGVELRLTEIIAPGQVFMPFHFAETNVNEVTQDAFDPISREPNYKQCAVRVERSGANA